MKKITLGMILLPLVVGNCFAANVNVNGATVFQTMNGVGTNVNSWAWKNGELKPALDALALTLGHNIFRVIHDRMEWGGAGATRPAVILTNLRNLDSATLQAVYETSDMQDLWNTLGYLNSKGVTGDQIQVNLMGWTARWMGGSGAYGSISTITNDAQTNQDIATMLASLVYYGHHRRDISGANQNLSFGYLGPFNEIDWDGKEGPQLSPSQLNTIYTNIITTLNAMGDTTTRLMGPDTASGPDSYTSAFSATVRARMTHFSWHSYSGAGASPAASRSGLKADWMTETSVWCSGCDTNQPPSTSEWSFGAGIGDVILGDIANGFSAVLTWEGFDTFYYHHNSYSAWGHVGCTQNGTGCTTSDASPRTYSIRGRAWPEATIAQAALPGLSRIDATTTLSNLKTLAFYSGSNNQLNLVGHNSASGNQTLSVQLSNLPNVANKAISIYFTNQNKNLEKQADSVIANGAFTITVPGDTFFLIRSGSSAPSVVSHPADTNSDYLMGLNEATFYGACWKKAPDVSGGCPANATLDYAVRAGTLWNATNNGRYQYNSAAQGALQWEVKP